METKTKYDFILNSIHDNSEKFINFRKQTEIAEYIQQLAHNSTDERIQSYIIKQGDVSLPLQQLGFYQNKQGTYCPPPIQIEGDLEIIEFANFLIKNSIEFKILLSKKVQGEIILKLEQQFIDVFSYKLKEIYKDNIFIFPNNFAEILIKFRTKNDDTKDLIDVLKAVRTYQKERGFTVK